MRFLAEDVVGTASKVVAFKVGISFLRFGFWFFWFGRLMQGFLIGSIILNFSREVRDFGLPFSAILRIVMKL